MAQWILWIAALFRGRLEDDYSMKPPFDLSFGGVVRDSADKVVREDRIRVGVFRPRRSRKCKDCGKASRWLVVELLGSRKRDWMHVISMHESRLPILQSVMEEVADYLAEDTGTPKRLPTVTLWGTRYFIDERLKELRNVEDPTDRVELRAGE